MRWRRRPVLSEEESNLILRLFEGEGRLDFTEDEFWMLDRFRRLKLIEPKIRYSNRTMQIQLTYRGKVEAAAARGRRFSKNFEQGESS